jgi:hypothetical protein
LATAEGSLGLLPSVDLAWTKPASSVTTVRREDTVLDAHAAEHLAGDAVGLGGETKEQVPRSR